MEPDLISIITPLFNREELILETAETVFSQTYSNWEWILVDDGSTDASFQVALNFAERDSRVRVMQRMRQPKGAPSSRNVGVEASLGKFIMFLDSDDLLHPECLNWRLHFLKSSELADFVVSNTLVFESEKMDRSVLWNVPNNSVDLIRRFLDFDVPWVTMSVLWRRETLLSIGAFDETLKSWQDWELHIRALAMGKRAMWAESEPDCYYRLPTHRETIGKQSLSLQHLVSHEATIEKVQGLVDEEKYGDSVAGLYFYIATALRKNAKRWLSIKIWFHARKLVPFQIFAEGALTLANPIKRIQWRLDRRIQQWPESIRQKFKGSMHSVRFRNES